MSKIIGKKLERLVCKTYAKLQSSQRVASRLDMAASTVYKILLSNSIHVPKRDSPENQKRKMALQGSLSKSAAKDYENGMPMEDMIAKYKVGQWAIRGAAKLHGLDIRKRGGRVRIFSASEIKEMASLYSRENWSQSEIGAQFHTTQSRVSQLLKSCGCKTRGAHAKREEHGSWNGGKSTIGGYQMMLVERDDPMYSMVHGNGYALEHRLVMARSLGRALKKDETVHHINGNKMDNRLSNLQLRFGKHGKGVAMVCAKCGSHEISYKELH